MRNLTIYTPQWLHIPKRNCWTVVYELNGCADVRWVRIETKYDRIEVIVSKFDHHDGLGCKYYVSLPSCGIAISGIYSLQESTWVTTRLLEEGLSPVNAITITQVLADAGDF